MLPCTAQTTTDNMEELVGNTPTFTKDLPPYVNVLQLLLVAVKSRTSGFKGKRDGSGFSEVVIKGSHLLQPFTAAVPGVLLPRVRPAAFDGSLNF